MKPSVFVSDICSKVSVLYKLNLSLLEVRRNLLQRENLAC
jgi:hypothetical protein